MEILVNPMIQMITNLLKKNELHHFGIYAHIEVVVTFLVVNFFGFLVITRHHGSFEGRHLVEILPTGLPELSKPKFLKSKLGKTKI